MDTIQVRDKQFKMFLPEEKIKARVSEVARQIAADWGDKKPLLLAVLNGSFVFAADLMRGIDAPCEIAFVRMASYQGTKSTGRVKELIGLTEDVEGRHIVVVEDIIDSGLTMKELLSILKEKHPAEVRIASLSACRWARRRTRCGLIGGEQCNGRNQKAGRVRRRVISFNDGACRGLRSAARYVEFKA